MNISKRGRRGKTFSIADVIPQIIRKIEKKSGGKLPVIAAKWTEIVGVEVARHTKPTYLQRRRLTVDVDDSVWMAELSRFHRKRMIDAVNSSFDEDIIKDINFRPEKATHGG